MGDQDHTTLFLYTSHIRKSYIQLTTHESGVSVFIGVDPWLIIDKFVYLFENSRRSSNPLFESGTLDIYFGKIDALKIFPSPYVHGDAYSRERIFSEECHLKW